MAYTTIDDPSQYFQTALWTGNNAANVITNDGNSDLQPDFLWMKERSSDSSNCIFDSSRGVGASGKLIYPDVDLAETTSDGVTSFDTDGFTLASNNGFNQSGQTNVGWQWKAGGTTPTKTYKVVVVSDSGNKYRFRNSADNATYAASAVTLDLQEGGTYTFDVSDSSVSSHPFVIGTSANSNEYSTGVVYKLDGVTKTYSQYTSGFSAATTRQLIITVAASAPTLYYWCSVHSGMGGQINTNTLFGSTNFDGSILSVVNVNTTAGFSIVRYVGNATSGTTVGHGLGAAPNVFFVKDRDATKNWIVYNETLGNDRSLTLNTNDQQSASTDHWANTSPTSSVFSLGDYSHVNANSDNFVAYCFSAIKGYSSFGSYQGNNNSEGPYIYTGFKPAWFLVKLVDNTTRNWQIWDSKRNASTPAPAIGNPRVRTISASENTAETGDYEVDFCSTGVKIRNDNSSWNGDNYNYVYWAFAECPLVAGGVVSTGG